MSLQSTLMQDFRMSNPNMSKYSARPSRYGTFDAFMMGRAEAPLFTTEFRQQASQAVGRTQAIPVFDQRSVTVSNTRTVTIADSDNDGAMKTIVYTTLAWGFTQVPARFLNNEFSMQEDWNQKFRTWLFAVGAELEDLALAALDANKTQVFGTTLVHSDTSDVLTSTNANKDRLISDLTPIMNSNNFFDEIHIVGNPGFQALVQELSKDGLYNAKNQTISFLDKTFGFTNALADLPANEATGYAINKGCLDVLFRHEAEAVLETQMADGTVWGKDVLPLLNCPVSTYYYEGAVDDSSTHAGTSHLERVRKRYYGYSVDVAFEVAYNNDLATQANPIIKCAYTTA